MDIKQIKEIINVVSGSNLGFFKVETSDIKLEMSKAQIAASVQEENASSVSHIESIESETLQKTNNKDLENYEIVAAPLAGIFLVYEDPNSKQSIKVGDIIESGQPICTIEAMKMVNVVESKLTGRIVEVLAKPLEFVEYDQPLYAIDTKDK